MEYKEENEGDAVTCPTMDASHGHTSRERSWTQETPYCVVQPIESLWTHRLEERTEIPLGRRQW